MVTTNRPLTADERQTIYRLSAAHREFLRGTVSPEVIRQHRQWVSNAVRIAERFGNERLPK